ncbi:conserved hypothetical protein [Perkinsus marinus ATCC 50983]|uniref:proton-translocating NAD(P)(+) transhydrogenase n=1 Tax=Perkinsus marinus (strain ATCC 50983 / TXsc) TaxID=423536 RepID=C5KTL3_PERM5|nr:conserved hypothetical protein [Perkinsus marinus ATCC 50983]EER12192.1 conserved hypothetical protein [Perkinsus marinus ATCC 50983]|eukprot:XP_002780397.1 conserved hypothetical protein [Perkinsus marinus ATCC 50983]
MRFFIYAISCAVAAATELRGSTVELPAIQDESASLISMNEAAVVFVGMCFMYALRGLGSPETATKGNMAGVIGMLVAIIFACFDPRFTHHSGVLAIICFVIAAVCGLWLSSKATMIVMPQMVAGFHASVGFAAVMVAYARYFDAQEMMNAGHLVETMIGIFFGAMTLTGSIVACGKLQGVIRSKALLLPFRHWINAGICLASILLTVWLCMVGKGTTTGMWIIIATTIICLYLGWALVMSIGGADMPVVVSMLNSYSGWTTVACGFMLSNTILIIAGSLIGSSGAILSYIMCKGMNRSFTSVILGGFGVEEGHTVEVTGTATETNVDEVAEKMINGKSVIIVPGYGMAVARCQQTVAGIADCLRTHGVKVQFAIHPVAGRLPGHMNVLLAEANVPYDIVKEMDEVNPEFPTTDVSLIIGANDIVNPMAVEDLSSPIGGMPVLEVWKAKTCVVMKRSMATGYSGIENPLFYKENTRMLFGNAHEKTQELLAALQGLAKEKKVTTADNASTPLLAEEKKPEPEKVKEYPPALKTIGVLDETKNSDETRVAIAPNVVSKFRDMGFAFVMERNCGEKASFPDRYYAVEGCKLVDTAEEVYKAADVIIKINTLTDQDFANLRRGQVVVTYLWPAFNPELLKTLAAKGVTAMSVDAVPRITRAQKLDTLSSMANMGGYKAIIEAFHLLPRFAKPLTTAAGSVPAANVFIIGAGVAGLSAIGTARSIGALVTANDTRSVVKEQVESMGAKFAEVPYKEEGAGSGGYAKEMSEGFHKAQMQLYSQEVKKADVVVTTAQIPGKPAPLLITKEMVRSMRPGSVIVDLAAQQGGNCELTQKDKTFLDPESGVTIIGQTNLARFMPAQASELFSANMRFLFDQMKGAAGVDEALAQPDDVIGPIRCTYQGQVTWKPVARPAPPPAPKAPAAPKTEAPVEAEKKPQTAFSKWLNFFLVLIVVGACCAGIGASRSVALVDQMMSFVMAVIVGYFLVWGVDHALHTPLMSETNAISGIIIVGAMQQLSACGAFAQICAILGTFAAGFNIFGGFWITKRMLAMFHH